MSLHKLNAGSGYDYLTRQVAALDATDKGHTGLASYYTERGESPEYVIALQATMAGRAADCRVWRFLIKGRRKRQPAARVLPTVRAAPP
jgi:hypothetical protein